MSGTLECSCWKQEEKSGIPTLLYSVNTVLKKFTCLCTKDFKEFPLLSGLSNTTSFCVRVCVCMSQNLYFSIPAWVKVCSGSEIMHFFLCVTNQLGQWVNKWVTCSKSVCRNGRGREKFRHQVLLGTMSIKYFPTTILSHTYVKKSVKSSSQGDALFSDKSLYQHSHLVSRSESSHHSAILPTQYCSSKTQ